MKNKPLARWTIGNVSLTGFEILNHSIKNFRKNYPEFDCLICYNEISFEKLPKKNNYFLQTHDCCKIPVKPISTNAWKLFPPRLRINSYEIFIDNDLIIYDRIPEIDKFLESNRPICYGCYDSRPLPYGIFSKEIKYFRKDNFILNSGFFGVFPHYDFENEIIYYLNKLEVKSWGYFDEQGLVALCLLNKNPIVIDHDYISNCWQEYKSGKYGCHFAGHNYENLSNWKRHKLKFLL